MFRNREWLELDPKIWQGKQKDKKGRDPILKEIEVALT